jgi:hypothetical protein
MRTVSREASAGSASCNCATVTVRKRRSDRKEPGAVTCRPAWRGAVVTSRSTMGRGKGQIADGRVAEGAWRAACRGHTPQSNGRARARPGVGLFKGFGLKVAHRIVFYRVTHFDRLAANLAVPESALEDKRARPGSALETSRPVLYGTMASGGSAGRGVALRSNSVISR